MSEDSVWLLKIGRNIKCSDSYLYLEAPKAVRFSRRVTYNLRPAQSAKFNFTNRSVCVLGWRWWLGGDAKLKPPPITQPTQL